MIYAGVAKPHIQDQVAKLNKIPIPPTPIGTTDSHIEQHR
jgi:hypothetical protein